MAGGVCGVDGTWISISTSPARGVTVPSLPPFMTLPRSLLTGGPLLLEGSLLLEPCVERELLLLMRLRCSRSTPPREGARWRSMEEERALILPSSLGDVNARESVRGRKKPSLPRGMLRPWTICGGG